MNSWFLYAYTVLIWGSTWIAITFQLGEVAIEVSLVYRFALASVVLFAWSTWRGLPLRISPANHLFIAAQGMFLFCLNYLVFYLATPMMTTGLISVIFSTVVLMNIANGAIFFKTAVKPRVLLGALCGLSGIALVFYPEIDGFEAGPYGLKGIGLCLLGTFLASLGNMASARNQKAGLAVLQTNAWGMGYGAALMAIYVTFKGEQWSFDPGFAYVSSLLYLSLFGSVIAFGSYLTLLGRIGPDRAAYATVLFPIVALGLSTLFEGYEWTKLAALGIALVLLGNVLVLARFSLKGLGLRKQPVS